ncbi:MAG: hypothetical protein GY752_05255 [bacterium]|nr:hypothetical protein [bacterium]MCP4799204.1 hypothetical protein [bacterium]
MKPKTIISTILLLFVVVSILFVVIKDRGSIVPGTNPVSEQMTAYYFHGNVRCKTCNTIELWTKEVVMQNQDLEWQIVNIDELENEHFIQDFQISSSTVVLSDGNNYSELDLVWQLVRDDKESFQLYIQNEIAEFLND